MSHSQYECVACGRPVTTVHQPGVGTVWTHVTAQGYFDECAPTYASPNFDRPVNAP